MSEIWKDIKLYEGLYQISNLGNIKSLGNNKCNSSKEKILKNLLDFKGYNRVFLYKNTKQKQFFIHRLVAQAFLNLDINNKKILVCHKDDNGLNNNIDNLFLGTHKDNTQDMIEKGRQKFSCIGKDGKHNAIKTIKQYTKDGKFLREWTGLKIAGEELNINYTNIGRCCRGERKTAGGYKWEYIQNKS